MPKLKKEKFKLNGDYISAQTTFPGDIELYSYYDVSNNNFYFDIKEIRKLFPDFLINDYGHIILFDDDEEKAQGKRKRPENFRHLEFKHCKTKAQAVAVLKAFLEDYQTTTRMLRVKLQLRGEFPNLKAEKVSPHFKKMLDWYHNTEEGESAFGIKIERVLKRHVGNEVAYENCDENWKGDGYIHHHETDLIEWDEKTEAFLIGTQKELNKMCLKIIDFFNTETMEELKIKMNSSKLLTS